MKRIIIIGIGILFTWQVQAGEPLSLTDAIVKGLENNYDLKIQRNDQKITEVQNSWGNAGALPTISLGATAREAWDFNSSDDYRQQMLVPELSLNWVLFDGFSALISKQRYDELENQSAGNTAILVENTIQDIILAYHNCLLQQEMTKVYEELAELSEDRYKRTEDSKNLGTGTTYESLQAKTSWLEDQSNYLQQKVSFENAVRTLNFALAVDNNTEWEFTTGLDVQAPDYDLATLNEKMMGNNSTLKNQYVYQTLLAQQTKLAQSSYYPSLSVNAGLTNTDLGQFFMGATTNVMQNYSDVYVGLSLSWTLFSGGTRKQSVAIARINEETSDVETTQMVHSLNNQLLQTYSNYTVNKAILALANEQEAAAKLNMELSAEKLKNGNINSFNYRDVQVNYMNAAIARFTAIYNLINSNTELLRLTGGIVDEYEQKE